MHYLPSRRTTSVKYKGKSLAQLLNMDIPEDDKLAPKTLETTFITVRSFINWLEEEALLDRERPAKHLNSPLVVLRQQAKADKRRRFTDEELRALFNSENFKPDAFRSAWQFWVPLMALTTGARIEELCQLHLDDIRQEEGTDIWFFDINSEDEKDVKTEAGKRMVPIHQSLIDLGLLDRVEALRKVKGTVRLFPTLNSRYSTGKLSGAVTQWFTRYRRTCGVGAEKGETSPAVFHSFRHALITKCKYLGLDRRKVQEMVGHEKGEFDDVTGRVYEDRYPVQAIHDAVVSKLDFSDVVDWQRLRRDKWTNTP
jgi:integrase